jgi:tRNA(Arg) A34 adenosine deaminase TadA
MTPSTQPLDHEHYMRKAFDVARQAKERAEHPFGCVLVGQGGEILMEQGNGSVGEGRDMTAHRERLMATRASKAYPPKFLAECTLYASAEPRAMCSGAIYWAGIGRLVFGQTEHDLKRATRAHEENPTLDLPCRTVLAAGQREVEVIDPLLVWQRPPSFNTASVELIHNTMKIERPVDGEAKPRGAAYGRSI